MAKQLSRKRLNKGRALTSPGDVKDHLRTLLQDYRRLNVTLGDKDDLVTFVFPTTGYSHPHLVSRLHSSKPWALPEVDYRDCWTRT